MITYLNGKEVSSEDLAEALDYQYGIDRLEHGWTDDTFTDEEKQKAVNYWCERCD